MPAATTYEHPSWVVGRGWTAANEVAVGDHVLSASGEELRVESVGESRREAVVYNFRVEELHTYFVGDPAGWGFDVWVHNAHSASTGVPPAPSKPAASPTITPEELIGKTAVEIRQLAQAKGLVPHPTKPDKWMDPVTGKERLIIHQGHTTAKGLPYDDPLAAAPHHHGYGPNGKVKIVDPSNGNPHMPTLPPTPQVP